MTLAQRVEVLESTPWLDPDTAGMMSADSPKPAGPGSPPNRLTIYVPWAQNLWTIANFGAEHAEQPFGNGIFMRTKEHIQWQTTEAFVTMGGNSSHISAPEGADGCPGNNWGYSLVTSRNAYLHADGQHLLRSLTDNMVLRTKGEGRWAVLQSNDGIAEVNSGMHVGINSSKKIFISAKVGFTPDDQTYNEDCGANWPEQSHSKGFSYAMKAIAKLSMIALTGAKTVKACKKAHKEAQKKFKGWEMVAASPTGVKALLNAAKMVAGASSLYTGDESIKSASYCGTSLWGNMNAGLFGHLCAGIGTLGMASIGGATADVKGYATAGVWGGSKCVIAGHAKSAGIQSHLHKVVMHSEGDVSFVSDADLICHSTTKSVSLRGEQKASLYGKNRVYVGAAGFGIVATSQRIDMAKINNHDNFKTAAQIDNHRISVTKNGVEARWKQARCAIYGEAKLHHHNKGLTLKPNAKVKAKTIDIDT